MRGDECQDNSVEQSSASLVSAAANGSRDAWDDLVERFAQAVWTVARSHRLGVDDATVVSRATWMRLVEGLNRIDDPERIGAWLTETARVESLRVLGLRDHKNARPTGIVGVADVRPWDTAGGVDSIDPGD